MSLELFPFVQNLLFGPKGTASIYATFNNRLSGARAVLLDQLVNLAGGPAALQAYLGLPTDAATLYGETSQNNNAFRDLDRLYVLLKNHIAQPPPPSVTGDSLARVYGISNPSSHTVIDPNQAPGGAFLKVQTGTGRYHHAILNVTSRSGTPISIFGNLPPVESFGWGPGVGNNVFINPATRFDGGTLAYAIGSYDANGGFMGETLYFPDGTTPSTSVAVAPGSIAVSPGGAVPAIPGATSNLVRGAQVTLAWPGQPFAAGYVLRVTTGAGSIDAHGPVLNSGSVYATAGTMSNAVSVTLTGLAAGIYTADLVTYYPDSWSAGTPSSSTGVANIGGFIASSVQRYTFTLQAGNPF